VPTDLPISLNLKIFVRIQTPDHRLRIWIITHPATSVWISIAPGLKNAADLSFRHQPNFLAWNRVESRLIEVEVRDDELWRCAGRPLGE
jgi:hypothetical protein